MPGWLRPGYATSPRSRTGCSGLPWTRLSAGHAQGHNVSLHMIDLGGDVSGNGISKLGDTKLPDGRRRELDSGGAF